MKKEFGWWYDMKNEVKDVNSILNDCDYHVIFFCIVFLLSNEFHLHAEVFTVTHACSQNVLMIKCYCKSGLRNVFFLDIGLNIKSVFTSFSAKDNLKLGLNI